MQTKPKLSPSVQAEVDLYSRMPHPDSLEPEGQEGASDDTGIPDYDKVLPPHILKAAQNAWKAVRAVYMRAGICVGDSPMERKVFLVLCLYVYESLKEMARNPQAWIVKQRAMIKEDSIVQCTDPEQFLKLLTEIEPPTE